MSAVMKQSRENAFDARATNAVLADWGNWYIRRTAHEFGWASHSHLLSYYGLFVSGHKILFDTPERVRFVDVGVGQLPELLRNALAAEYWWHRELSTGRKITIREKAEALGLESPSQFKEVVRTAKLLAQRVFETLDCRREVGNIS